MAAASPPRLETTAAAAERARRATCAVVLTYIAQPLLCAYHFIRERSKKKRVFNIIFELGLYEEWGGTSQMRHTRRQIRSDGKGK